MKESIYKTPRTYGAPTGYDQELSHYPSTRARLSERLLLELCQTVVDEPAEQIAVYACDIAEAMAREWERRNWLLEVKDAPGMKQDYGQERGKP